MINKLIFIMLLAPALCAGQTFNRPAKESVIVPNYIIMQLEKYLEKHEGKPIVSERFVYLPAFNILNRSERTFIDGIYFFVDGVHDSGTLFINRKGKITILPSDTPTAAIVAYAEFLKKKNLSETMQIEYAAAIAAFLEYKLQDQTELMNSGNSVQPK